MIALLPLLIVSFCAAVYFGVKWWRDRLVKIMDVEKMWVGSGLHFSQGVFTVRGGSVYVPRKCVGKWTVTVTTDRCVSGSGMDKTTLKGDGFKFGRKKK